MDTALNRDCRTEIEIKVCGIIIFRSLGLWIGFYPFYINSKTYVRFEISSTPQPPYVQCQWNRLIVYIITFPKNIFTRYWANKGNRQYQSHNIDVIQPKIHELL